MSQNLNPTNKCLTCFHKACKNSTAVLYFTPEYQHDRIRIKKSPNWINFHQLFSDLTPGMQQHATVEHRNKRRKDEEEKEDRSNE